MKYLIIPMMALIMAGCSTANKSAQNNLITCIPECYKSLNTPAPKCVEITGDGNIGECANVSSK